MIFSPAFVPDEVEALVLFGSQVRGDADSSSDIDVAAFVKATSVETLIKTKKRLCVSAPACNLSVYSLGTATSMAEDGSLFLWHLKFEGRYLFVRDGYFPAILSSLRPYSCDKALRDIGTFEEVLADVRMSLTIHPDLMLYESATLFSVLRSLGMIASTIDGCSTFRRVEPINYLTSLMNGSFLLSEADIARLVTARHLYARNIGDDAELDQAFVQRAASAVSLAARFVRNHVSRKLL